MPGPDLDTRLADLAATPVPPLPGAVAARARGAQRTRRGRSALAGAGAVVAVVVLSTGLALTEHERDRVTPAPLVTGGTSWDATSALLTPQDAASAEPGAWRVIPTEQPRLLDPCAGGTTYPQDEAIQDTSKRSLQGVREEAATSLVQEVARYRSTDDATAALASYRRAVSTCPSKPTQDADTSAMYRALSAADAFYVTVRMDCPVCRPDPTYVAVVQVGDGLAVLRIAVNQDGDPGLSFARKFVDQARLRLTTAQSAAATDHTAAGIRHVVDSHCGVVSTTIEGALWLAAPPLVDDSHNSPSGWNENETPGVFHQTSATEGVFTADSGVQGPSVEPLRARPTRARTVSRAATPSRGGLRQ